MRKILIIFLLLTLIVITVYRGNTTVGTSYYEISSHRLPSSFEGYKILQLSDLHDAKFGKGHERVVERVKSAKPDVIFITGDFIDGNRYDLKQSLQLIEKIKDVAPIYYVTGNHEISTNDVARIKDSLQKLGVRVLSDQAERIRSAQNESILIGGIEDPLSSTLADEVAVEEAIQHAFKGYSKNEFRILLSHRPEFWDLYVKDKIDVTFSGHAHGGQFRIPGFGGMIAPGQGFLPKITEGVHEKEGSQLVVSRGLGNSVLPIRLFNPPEIIVVTLRRNE